MVLEIVFNTLLSHTILNSLMHTRIYLQTFQVRKLLTLGCTHEELHYVHSQEEVATGP